MADSGKFNVFGGCDLPALRKKEIEMMSTKKESKKYSTVLIDRVTGMPLITVDLFLKLMLQYGILTKPEVIAAKNTGLHFRRTLWSGF